MPDEAKPEPETQVADVALKMATMLWRNSGMRDPTLNDQDFVKLVASCSMALQGRYALFDFRNRLQATDAPQDSGWQQRSAVDGAVTSGVTRY